MSIHKARNCPICSSRASTTTSFPHTTKFNGYKFMYLKCCNCATVFVDPIPDKDTFLKMYAKNTYHDNNYDSQESEVYKNSVRLLKEYISIESDILDYGCGIGTFLKELNTAGFNPYGVEFDADAAEFAARESSCKVWTSDDFWKTFPKQKFDAVHLGDVLEHLPDPKNTLDEVLKTIKSGGILFVEGPLETNPSLVYLATLIFGWIKHKFQFNYIANDSPHHLFKIDGKQQFKFFYQIETPLNLEYWRVYETGWPYTGGGLVKRIIAKVAIFFGGKSIFGSVLGNRFQAIFIKT